MGQMRLVSPRSFCWNRECPDYGKIRLAMSAIGVGNDELCTALLAILQTGSKIWPPRNDSQGMGEGGFPI